MEELGLVARYEPIALAFDRAGNLLVTADNHQIHRLRYDPVHSTLISDTVKWGGFGTELGKFGGVSGLAADKNGFVFVTEPLNHRVQVLHQEPSPIGFVAITSISMLTATGALDKPFGIAVDDRADPTIVYVSDATYAHVVKLSFDNVSKQLSFVGIIGSYGTTAGHFVSANHLDVDDEGFLWVADSSYRVHRINPNNPTDPENGWRIYGSPSDPAWYANGVAITKTLDGKALLYVSSTGYGQISSFTPMDESDPLATLVHCSGDELFPGDALVCVGSGQDGDATNITQGYQWFTNSRLTLTITTPEVTIPTASGPTTADVLGSGIHTLWFRTQDDEGDWSQPISTTIYVAPQVPELRPTNVPTPDPVQPPPAPPVTCPAGQRWTLLLYLDADNKNDGSQLLEGYRRSLEQLKKLNHACVRVAAQVDGPASIDTTIEDTQRLLLDFNANGSLPVSTTWTIAEQPMDTPVALSDFIKWGQQQLPSDHYYLAIADHGNAYQGIAFDHTSDASGNAYLTAGELGAAITAPGVLPIDIVHLDACSMALFDVAYELRDQVDYLIASQYIGWSFFAYGDYARYIDQWTTPEQLTTLIVERYGKATIGGHNGDLNAWSDLILNTEGGNVGIGTVAPEAKLHVAGDMVVQAGTKKLVFSSGAAVDIVAPTNSLFIASRATGPCPWECNNVLINPWPENGKVGIGTIDPEAKLHVAGDFIVQAGTKKIVMTSGAAVDIVAPTNSLFIASRGTGPCPWECNNVLINPWGENGNVGIGTATPQAKLDVIGTTRSSVLQITGGSDLAELFSQADGTLVEPGTVMVIDPEHAGKLMMSASAYDRKVAGIISGAGDVNPGLTLQQEGVLDGNLPVAIAGRVYVKAEALSGAIEPGDLLTTSDMAGYAMKATNDDLSHGAIIGKAMTGLDEGTGLVLVLVNLQ